MEITAIKNEVGTKWEMVKIGDLIDVLSGFAFDSKCFNESIGMPLIRIRDIKRSYSDTFYNGEFDERFIINRGDILIGMDGEFNIAEWKGSRALLNQRVCKVSVSDDNRLFIRYLLYFLPFQLKIIEDKASFVTVKHLSVNDIKNIQIPLPPLATQKRIAEILDAADALRRKDQALLQKYDELAQSIFMDMFGDPVKNEKGFNFIKLGDCLANIQIGPFGTQLHESDYIKNGIPIINPMHIGDLKIKPNYNYSISEAKYSELPQYHLKEDDIILGRRGEMGRCAIVTKNQGRCLCGTGSLYLSVNKDLLDPLFLVYILSRKSTKIALENVSAGTTMANLNKDIINNFKIILPKLEKQKDFVKAIKMSEKSIDFTNLQIEKSSYIFQTLLQKAFNGALVP